MASRFHAWGGLSGEARPNGRVTHAGVAAVEAALKAHGSVHQSGQDWQCPAHDDKRASLGVLLGDSGKVLLNCAAGCTPQKIVKALGLHMSDLFPAEAARHYDYTDAEGRPLFRVTRRADKGFSQGAIKPDGSVKTGAGAMAGVPRVLYRLPAVLAAAFDGKIVYVVEGEKDVENLEKLGEVATTNPGGGGTGKWLDEYSQSLVGARVVVIVDRDLTGYKHAQEIVASLRTHTVRCRIMAPVPTTEHADVSDHIEAGLSIADLVSLTDEDLERLISGQNGDEDRWPWRTGADLGKPVKPMRWLVQGLWAANSHGVVAGEEKTLKSYVVTAIAVAIAAGVPALGRWAVPEPGPVLMLVGEGGELPFQRRIQRIAEAYAVDITKLPIYATSSLAPMDSREFRDNMAYMLDEVKPKLTILDPTYAYHPHDIDASNLYARGPVLAALAALITDAGSALMSLDHFNKTGNGVNLARISMAGTKEWADSWILQEHIAPPDLIEGRFKLGLTIGSRQWGGREHVVEFNVGALSEETGEFEGDISWLVEDRQFSVAPSSDNKAAVAIRTTLIDHDPYTLTRTQLRRAVGGNRDGFDKAFALMVKDGELTVAMKPADEGGKPVVRERIKYEQFMPMSAEE